MLIVAMAAGYMYQFEPVTVLADLGIVLFLLLAGLEAAIAGGGPISAQP